MFFTDGVPSLCWDAGRSRITSQYVLHLISSNWLEVIKERAGRWRTSVPSFGRHNGFRDQGSSRRRISQSFWSNHFRPASIRPPGLQHTAPDWRTESADTTDGFSCMRERLLKKAVVLPHSGCLSFSRSHCLSHALHPSGLHQTWELWANIPNYVSALTLPLLHSLELEP